MSDMGHLRDASAWGADAILHAEPPEHPRSAWIIGQAEAYLNQDDAGADVPDDEQPAERLIGLIVEQWPAIARGAHDGDVMHHQPGLWRAFNRGFPMGLHGQALAYHVQHLLPAARVLEIGAGTGNTTGWLDTRVTHTYTASDLHPDISRKAKLAADRIIHLDIDDVMHSDAASMAFDLILGTNVAHCATDPTATLTDLAALLAPGGTIALAEGTPENARGLWPLTWVCGIFDGWWDRGGFRTTLDWCAHLTAAGLTDVHALPIEHDEETIGTILTGRRA